MPPRGPKGELQVLWPRPSVFLFVLAGAGRATAAPKYAGAFRGQRARGPPRPLRVTPPLELWPRPGLWPRPPPPQRGPAHAAWPRPLAWGRPLRPRLPRPATWRPWCSGTAGRSETIGAAGGSGPFPTGWSPAAAKLGHFVEPQREWSPGGGRGRLPAPPCAGKLPAAAGAAPCSAGQRGVSAEGPP